MKTRCCCFFFKFVPSMKKENKKQKHRPAIRFEKYFDVPSQIDNKFNYYNFSIASSLYIVYPRTKLITN